MSKSKKHNEKINDEISFKIITIGDSGVGKTSIIRRYVYDAFNDNTISTIGVTFCYKDIEWKSGEKIKLKLIDTAGQEKFNALTKTYFKNVDGVLFVFDYNNPITFEDIENWISLFEENNSSKGIPT